MFKQITIENAEACEFRIEANEIQIIMIESNHELLWIYA